MEKVRYTVVIPNERYRLAKKLHVSLLIVFSLALTYVSAMKHDWGGIIAAALALLSLLGLFRKTKKTANRLSGNIWEIGFFWLWMGWFHLEYYGIFVLIFIISILSILIRSAYEIRFSSSQIQIRSFPKKTIKWFELNNAVLKDDLLTIDFRNDKLMQAEILAEESDVEDEAAFNEYCQQQLKTDALAI